MCVSRSSQRMMVTQTLLMALAGVLTLLSCFCFGASRFPLSHNVSPNDRRVAWLRGAILNQTSFGIERLPDPPLEIGVHAACKKFGRGCPDAYLNFLEEFFASLQRNHSDAPERSIGVVNTVHPGDCTNPQRSVRIEWEQDCDANEADILTGVAAAGLSRDLRIPLSPTWSYEARRRLENLLHLLAARETELSRLSSSSALLLREYRLPSPHLIHLVEDEGGVMAARLNAACALGMPEWAPSPPARGWTHAEWENVYGAWCSHMERYWQRQNTSRTSSPSPLTAEVPLAPLPPKSWRCTLLLLSTVYMECLLPAHRFMDWAFNLTMLVALPSAFLVVVAMWLCAGDSWTKSAEDFVQGTFVTPDDQVSRVGDGVSADVVEGPQLTSGPTWEASSPFSAVSTVPSAKGALVELSKRHRGLNPAAYQASQIRLALLRSRFTESVLHRSPFLFFLKLRLLLCLLVALQLLWDLGQTLAAIFHLTSTAPLVTYFLPSLLLPTLIAYLIIPIRAGILAMAVKGALSAYEELLLLQVDCAEELRDILGATGLHFEE